MNPAQLKAQIDRAAAEAYERGRKEGTEIAVNKARSFMPTALAQAHKQGVMDLARFLDVVCGPVRAEDMADLRFGKTDLTEIESRYEVKTPGGINTVCRTLGLDWKHGAFRPLTKFDQVSGVLDHSETKSKSMPAISPNHGGAYE